MDSSTTNFAYQYARNESCRARSPLFPTSVTRKSCPSLRQFHSGCLYQHARGGGAKSLALCRFTWDGHQWAEQRAICLRAAHIPGKRNILADDLSRGRQGVKVTVWSVHQEVADMLFQRLRHPNIDLFVIRENKKLPIFCSPYPDHAWASDALSVS